MKEGQCTVILDSGLSSRVQPDFEHNRTFVVTYAHYACVADCADAMADAWEDTAGCAQAVCLHENLLKR